jgi:hypothetical protein
MQPGLMTLDMSGDDEPTIALRLDGEMPAVVMSGVRHVLLDLGERAALRRSTADQIALAHRELRAVGGRLVVVGTSRAASACARVCPELFVAATVRQAQAALGLPDR